MADVTMKPCGDCGMPCTSAEYHPYAACLMFKACHNSATVRANLPDYEALRKRCEAAEADAARYRAIRAVDDSAPVGIDGYPRLTQWAVVASARGSGNLLFGTDLDRVADAIIAAAQEPSHG